MKTDFFTVVRMVIFAGILLLLTAGVGFGMAFDLNMSENSVDDQYEGCANMSMAMKSKHLDQELVGELKSAWENGKKWWSNEKATKTKDISEDDDYYIALYVYTDSATGIYSKFNKATRSGKNDYIQRTYQWYSLHFFLTRAVQVLKESEKLNEVFCRHTFRGTNVTFEKNVIDKDIRLGSFTSSSLDRQEAEKFGRVSCFEITTCHGIYVKSYSANPHEDEVLIPPYEKFKVTKVKHDDWCATVYMLDSNGVWSDLNCGTASGISLIDHSKTLWVACVCFMMFSQSHFIN